MNKRKLHNLAWPPSPVANLLTKFPIKKREGRKKGAGPDIGSQLEQSGQMTVITTRNDSLVAFRVIHTIALEAAAACARASLPRLSRALNFLRPFRD